MRKNFWRASLALAACATAGACGGGGDGGAATPAPVTRPYETYGPGTWPVPAAVNALAADAPGAQGQFSFVFDTFGAEVYDNFPPVEFVMGLLEREPEVFGRQFEKFGFIPRDDHDLPIGLERGTADPSRMMFTCVTCHVAKLPDGRVWLGAPNDRLDLTGLRLAIDERWVAAGNPSMFTELGRAKSRLVGPGRGTGDPALYEQVVPFDIPTFYSLGERVHLGAMGIERDVRTSTYLALYLGTDVGRPNAVDTKAPYPPLDRLDAMVAYIANLQPPPAPEQPAAEVARGRAVYEAARCGSCHHPEAVGSNGVTTLDDAPDGKERYPGDDAAFPNGSIRTNALLRVLQDGDTSGDAAFDIDTELVLFIFNNNLAVQKTDGYRVDDLRGLWASAPYLHNGSVPTLEDLLKPKAERPATWNKHGFTIDTTLIHNGNEGHEFGVDLPAADKAALVAYLKTL